MPQEIPSEAALLARAKGGDSQAFAELVRRHQQRVRDLCRSILRNEEEADDAAQEVFIKCWRHLAGFRGESTLATWLYRTSYRHCLDNLKTRRRRPSEPLEDDFTDPARSPAQQTADRDTVHNLLSKLPEQYRVVLTLREAQGLTYEEIAAVTKTSLDSVKARLRRARLVLLDLTRHLPVFSDV